VLERLPPALAKDLLDQLYKVQIKAVPMFKGLQEEVVLQVCFAL
jgi:hypothetical protein